MSNYRLLNYSATCSETFEFSSKPAFAKQGKRSDEYMHEEYGVYEEDCENALAHAAWMLDQLKEDPSEENRGAFATDVRNYIDCVNYGIGEREPAYEMFEAALSMGMDDVIIDIVNDYFFSNKEISDEGAEPLSPDQVLNFDALYIKAGDRALFQNGDAERALDFYDLAALEWNEYEWHSALLEAFSNKDEGKIDPLNGLSLEEAEAWVTRASAFRQLWNGHTGVDLSVFDCKAEDLTKLFDRALQQAKAFDHGCADTCDALIELVGDRFDTVDDRVRICLIMIAALRRHGMLPVLDRLSGETPPVIDAHLPYVLPALRYLARTQYGAIASYADTAAADDLPAARRALRFAAVVRCANNIQEQLRVKNEAIEPAYYTSFRTFSHMLPENCAGDKEDQCGRLSIMDVSYMNDPNEGLILRKFLMGDRAALQSPTERKELKAPFVFIKCFTTMVDYLPMWNMYADGAKGLCVVLRKTGLNQLYHVCYLNKSASGYSVRKVDNPYIEVGKVQERIRELKRLYTGFREAEREVCDQLISNIRYLFKDSSYSYEHEMRFIYRRRMLSEKFRHTAQQPPMLFYVPSDPIHIKELILGPKFENTANTIPYLQEQVEQMSRDNRTPVPRITLSNIDFR